MTLNVWAERVAVRGGATKSTAVRRTLEISVLVGAGIGVALLALGLCGGFEADEAASLFAMLLGFPAAEVTQVIPGLTWIRYWMAFVALTMLLNGIVLGTIAAGATRFLRARPSVAPFGAWGLAIALGWLRILSVI